MSSWTRPLSTVVSVMILGCGGGEKSAPKQAGPSEEIAFVSNRDGDYEIYLLNLSSGEQRKLTDNDASDYSISWSPDGDQIAFSSNRDGNREIYVMSLSGGEPIRLTRDPADDMFPAWSPDGARIAFISDRDSKHGEIYVMDVDGTHVHRLTRNDRYDEVPAWSPDGQRLAFGALSSSRDEEPTLQVFIMDLSDSTERQLTNLPGHNSAPRWSPDGSRIAFYGNVGEDFEGADIFTIAPDGSGLSNLTRDSEPDWQPDWSADGSTLVFARGPGDPLDLWVMNSNGTDRRRIMADSGRDEQPYWRPRSR